MRIARLGRLDDAVAVGPFGLALAQRVLELFVVVGRTQAIVRDGEFVLVRALRGRFSLFQHVTSLQFLCIENFLFTILTVNALINKFFYDSKVNGRGFT